MRFGRATSFGKSTNAAVGQWASRVDDQTGAAGQRVAAMIVMAVRLLRIPTAVVLAVPLPFIVGFLLVALAADGTARIVCLVLTAAMAAVSAAFWWRRRSVLRAVEEPDKLATELSIMISLSDKVTETR